jgi:hypothetical protein
MSNNVPASQPTIEQLVSGGLHRMLNSHGHAFQNAVLEELNDLFSNRLSSWYFQAAEFPVVCHGEPIHIDFILRHQTRSTLLVAECKRANPKLNHWAFLRSEYIHRDQQQDRCRFDQVARNNEYSSHPFHMPEGVLYSNDVAHIHHVLRLKEEATSSGKPDRNPNDPFEPAGRNAISDAVTQVFRGTTGLIDRYCDHRRPPLLQDGETLTVFPVIFTTARIWMAKEPLKGVSVVDGSLAEAPEISEKDWIALQVPVSSDLRPKSRAKGDAQYLADVLEREHLRTVFVVSSRSIERFLRWSGEALPW